MRNTTNVIGAGVAAHTAPHTLHDPEHDSQCQDASLLAIASRSAAAAPPPTRRSFHTAGSLLPYQAVNAPQLIYTDVLAHQHIAKVAHTGVLRYACELVDHVLLSRPMTNSATAGHVEYLTSALPVNNVSSHPRSQRPTGTVRKHYHSALLSTAPYLGVSMVRRHTGSDQSKR